MRERVRLRDAGQAGPVDPHLYRILISRETMETFLSSDVLRSDGVLSAAPKVGGLARVALLQLHRYDLIRSAGRTWVRTPWGVEVARALGGST